MTDKTSLAQALTLSESDVGLCAHIPVDWAQGRATFGGLVGALLARAVERVVPEDRSLRSVLIDFIAPVAPGEVTLQTRVLRSGRALSHAEGRLVQNGEVAALFVGVYASARATNLNLPGAPAPSAPHAEQLVRQPYIEGLTPRFTQHFEFRLLPNRELFTSRPDAKVGGYARHATQGPADAAGVLMLIDAWPPAFMPTLPRPMFASSVTWMVDIVGTLPPSGTESHAFYRYEAEAVAAAQGYASCEGRVWGPDGNMLATSRQFVAEFS